MNTSDYILIGTTLFLGLVAISVAIFGPYWGELIKQKYLAPKLSIEYKHDFPFCKKVAWFNLSNPAIHQPVYFFNFQINNIGKSQARKVEASIEKLYICDAAGNYKELPNFSPFKLRYDESGTRFVDINPNKPIEWAIGHISCALYQKDSERNYFLDVPNIKNPTALRFSLEQLGFSYAGPNCLVPGNYQIKICLNSENADVYEQYFKIAWSGNWRENEQDMYSEIVITPMTKTI
jgi:hypothetical protein